MFTDSHCHLTMLGERASEVLDRGRAAGVRGVVIPGTELEDSPAAVDLARQHEDVWAAVGFHPHEARKCDDAAFAQIEKLAAEKRVVAIGEIGLDYHYNFSPRQVQREVLARHLDLARRLSLPVIIHNRESTHDLLELLENTEVTGVLHSFTESYEVARKLVDQGFVISFSGILTFRNAEQLREVARRLPHHAVLIETDTPYLAPIPYRGKENEPAYVVKIAELLGQLWGIDLDEVGRLTTGNFERVFGVTIRR